MRLRSDLRVGWNRSTHAGQFRCGRDALSADAVVRCSMHVNWAMQLRAVLRLAQSAEVCSTFIFCNTSLRRAHGSGPDVASTRLGTPHGIAPGPAFGQGRDASGGERVPELFESGDDDSKS